MTAIRTITRVQDADDTDVSLGAGVDTYAFVYEHDTGKFVLRAPADAVASATGADDVVAQFNALLANLRSSGTLASVLPFASYFSALPDGALPASFAGTTWSIVSGKAINTPTVSATNIVDNGDFSTDPGGWSMGAGWSIGSNTAIHAPGSASNLAKSVGAVSQTWYSLTYTIVVNAGSCSPNVGGSYTGIARTVSGTYTEVMQCQTNEYLYFQAAANFDGTIANVSLKALTTPAQLVNLIFTETQDVTVKVLISSHDPGYQVGLVISADTQAAPANYVLGVFHNGRILMQKNVDGTITQIVDAANVWSANKVLKIIKIGDTFKLVCDGVMSSLAQTVSGMTGLYAGLFNTGPASGISQISVVPSFREPLLFISFDDGMAADYAAFQYMQFKGIRGTAYIVSDNVDQAGYITTAQLQEMYAAGWSVGNHTKSHLYFDTLTQAQIEAEIQACTTFLDAAGMTRSSKHVAYPGGVFSADSDLAMDALGMISGRTVTPQAYDIGIIPRLRIGTGTILQNTALATVTGYIDTAIANKTVCALLFHNPWQAGEFSEANFKAVIDYAAASGIRSINIEQLYEMQQYY